jgi:hypothetical protein
MTKRDTKVKLPDDFLGTVEALLHTPPPPKAKKPPKRNRRPPGKAKK